MRAVLNVPQQDAENAKAKEEAATEENFTTKLAKFIPAEVTAVYAALAVGAAAASNALNPEQGEAPVWPLWVAFAVGLLAVPLYWWVERQRSAVRKEQKREPVPVTRWYGYLLATIAFVPWALAVSTDTRELMKVPDEVAEFLLIIAALVIPGLNVVGDSIAKARMGSEEKPDPEPSPPGGPATPGGG